ncbi:hypothetical protein ASD28_17350 [Massilia sp. Root133]|uniref:YkgJ family cysteine cluster protein n=1 Tax=unclassified Massilia TaxID=2609279 RepID=UPI0006F49BA9|nr:MULTISPECIES: YkgJ family cysteine cluster protein [unclassified Massilia]KQX96857.1 hypothetical protein ASD28_17350 [Massilia sp. Root133]KQZ52565.1 hypothetical protein ASD92_18780 [Massilia sp. Root1485]
MLDAVTLDAIEKELSALLEDGSEPSAQRAKELVETLEAAVEANQQMKSEPVQQKLRTLLEEHPWMASDVVEREIGVIANENASIRSKRSKVIAIANRMTEALAPHVACRAGCSSCCHMNTIIYEHEAIRLAEVSGRKMTRLPFRPSDVVFAEGLKFNGRPCPFLVENRCSVYEDRPLVCRTHHSLREDATQCSMEIPTSLQVRPPMYDPDNLELPYRELNVMHNLMEPHGNIAEFFPD